MIIVDNRYKENIRAFGEVNPGDCFVYNGEYFMKTTDLVNAVNLETGKIRNFRDIDKITAIRMKAEVIWWR